jgi:FkbH-like protein
MVLKEDDFACFVANFDDKATNIRRIAATLDLGIGSFVMVDDNPVERAWLRRELPELLVPELPDEPAGYVRALDELNPFAVLRLTAEDATRARSYRARAAVAEMRSNAANLDSFLASLEPVAVVEPVYAATLDRIAQIVAKTNQFKLNPTVYGTEEIRARAGDVIALRLKDRLQDYGIVAVAVSRLEGADLRIENWVMSCRVFSRRLEHVMRELLAERARAAGAAGLRARYEETPRNGLMKEVLTGLGFVPGPGDWVAPASVAVPPHHMRIEGVEAWRRGAA